MKKVFLYPGKLHASRETTEVTTLLGSCVGVAMFDPTTKIGGLNHYLLANVSHGESPNERYGEVAIPQLVDEMVKLGALRSQIRAKVYGGANVLTQISKTEAQAIGTKNIEMATKTLKNLGIPVDEKIVGGSVGCKIIVNTSTFEVKHNFNRNGETEETDISGYKKVAPIKREIKVLIVDDSATVRTLFSNIFTKNGLKVVGAATDPYEAREMLSQHKPDVMTLDIEMPKMNGVQFLEKVMQHFPVPVVMVSSLGANGPAAMKALELGAVEFVHKPSQFDPAVLRTLGETLIEKIKAAAYVPTLKARPKTDMSAQASVVSTKSSTDIKLALIGGNAGSPDAIERILQKLDADTPPVVISCPTITTFVEAFIDKMKKKCRVSLSVAKDGEILRLGNVYFVPANVHGRIAQKSGEVCIHLDKGVPMGSQIPSTSVLFKTAASQVGAATYAVLLSGYGGDGVDGLQVIQAKGGVTVTQNPSDAPFPFAPQKAVELGVADSILHADEIANHLYQMRSRSIAA